MVAYMGRNLNYGYINTVAKFPGQLDARRLRRAVRLSVDAEPILGCRFIDAWHHPYWQRRNDLDKTDDLFSFFETDDPDSALEACLNELPDSRFRPQIHISLIRNKRDTLCLKFNHMVGDGFSMYYIFICWQTYTTISRSTRITSRLLIMPTANW